METRIVRGPEEIRSILSCPEWTVKSSGNDVPEGIRGSAAGTVYARFARMTDGDRHRMLRGITDEVMSGLEVDAIPRHVRSAFSLIENPTPTHVQFDVPGLCMAGLLGIPVEECRLLVALIRDFVTGARDTASSTEAETARKAVEHMLPIARQWPAYTQDTDTIASRIALLYQTSDAMAALVGNALIGFADSPLEDPDSIVGKSMARRVPVRSTTRFNGDTRVVLDLEAAHSREPGSQWTFGYGAHRCPGSSLAIHIAVEIIRFVQEQTPFQPTDIEQQGWEPLPNLWIPVLRLNSGDET